MTDAETSFIVDRLWPEPAAGLHLDAAVGDLDLHPPPGRPLVAMNMVTSIDGRAQLKGTAEGLGSRADRRLMQRYRAAFDAVGSGVGTLRQAGLWLRLGRELSERRRAAGRTPQPIGVLIAGDEPIDTDARWFGGDEPRIVIVGVDNPTRSLPAGAELVRAPTPRPDPAWLLARLAERGIGSLLLEGGPRVNAAFLARRLIDEVYWTIGAHLLGTDALPMVAPIPGGSPFASEPWRGRLVGVLRHGDELFLRYRFGNADAEPVPAP